MERVMRLLPVMNNLERLLRERGSKGKRINCWTSEIKMLSTIAKDSMSQFQFLLDLKLEIKTKRCLSGKRKSKKWSMRKQGNKPRLCNSLGRKRRQSMSKITYMKKCWKMRLDKGKKDWKDLDYKLWVRFMSQKAWWDLSQHKFIVTLARGRSLNLSRGQCLGIVRSI